MSYVLAVVAFIVIFSILILVHEFGHFIMAKKAGIKVEEFGFGLPPRIWGKKKGETIYSVNWIPFGGFVRMYGEDLADAKARKSSRSFSSKSMRARVLVIIAGVVMNFLLAWFLVFIGLTVGMQPLLGPDDVFPAVSRGQVILEEGVKVKTVEPGSLAAQAGFKADDVIYAINDSPINDTNFANAEKSLAKAYGVVRNGNLITLRVSAAALNKDKTGKLGLALYDFVDFPRIKIFNLKPDTVAAKAGLLSGDVILAVNGQQLFSIPDYENLIRGLTKLDYTVYRDGLVKKVTLERSQSRKVIIESVLPGSAAEKAGLKAEDIILKINDKPLTDSQQVIDFVAQHKTDKLAYLIQRDDQQLYYEIQPVDGHVGILLSELMSYVDDQGISVYNVDLLSSISKINDEKYPFYIAIYKSLGETWHLSVATADMFGGFLSSLLSSGKVPDSVAGPVGIAQMTHTFVQEGFIPLLRFMAVLSLSLAVINILPFPALDGGRLLFIIIEFVIGRRVNQKWENWIHAFGYFLIMLLILVVTYTDIMRMINN